MHDNKYRIYKINLRRNMKEKNFEEKKTKKNKKERERQQQQRNVRVSGGQQQNEMIASKICESQQHHKLDKTSTDRPTDRPVATSQRIESA